MTFTIHKGEWSEEICSLLNIPMNMLPEVKDCAADFGEAMTLGGVPIFLGDG